MPVTSGRKAIRFNRLNEMWFAISQDKLYQHRHLVLEYLMGRGDCTRKEVSDQANVPINAVSKVVSGLVEEGAIIETGRMKCPITGRNSTSIRYDSSFKGPY